MKHLPTIVLLVLFIGCSKQNEKKVEKEPWINLPVEQWPDFALTNEIAFTDTVYSEMANSFLIQYKGDTLGISCKHLFLVFALNQSYTNIKLKDDFRYWKIYPKNNKEQKLDVVKIENENENEPIGQFNTLKVRDWIILKINQSNKNIYPLKIREEPLKPNEIIYAVGWGMLQKDNTKPAVVKMQCFKNMGNYYYVKTLDTGITPNGRSGSPVIDKNGYLVGIVSGAEGNLGVIGSVAYLKDLLEN